MWEDLGFKKNIYETHPIKADEQGERLLVGREKELRLTINRLTNMDNTVTVEGPNGVGKTSLLLVAGHKIDLETKGQKKRSLIPMPEPFQINTEETYLDFKRKVYCKIAEYFKENEKELRDRLDLQFNLNPLDAWLNNPIFQSASATVAGFGGGSGRVATQSPGFDNHGFFSIVDKLLQSAFVGNGGLICIVDNLEILNTSSLARQKIEEMRDEIFAHPKLKWVICGARGIVRSVASSPRMQGRLLEPLIVNPLKDDFIRALIETRVKEHSIINDATPPVGVASFETVFHILNSNLRDSLKFCEDFSLWLFENDEISGSQEEYDRLFAVWLADQADRYLKANRIPPRALRLLEDLCSLGETASPSDYAMFEFNSRQNMRGHIVKLEEAGFVSSELVEGDGQRKAISVTAKGWLVNYARNDYDMLVV